MTAPANQHFDQLDFDYLQALVGDPKGTVLEIGANNGSDTNRLLEAFPRAQVYAFEPDPRAIAKFKHNVDSPRARLFECAIGATDGSAIFHTSNSEVPEAPELGGWDQSGSLRVPKSHLEIWPWVKFEEQITVPVMALDSFYRQQRLDVIDLIWADTQGAEGDLVTGGRLALSRTRYLYTEYSNDEWYEGQVSLDQLLALLPDFRLLRRFSTDVLLENHTLKNGGNIFSSLKRRLRQSLFS
jgi:FkbM family methyltransferase